MDDEKDRKSTRIDDWMVRIAFAEAGEPDMGFEETGVNIERKSKLALDRIMVVREEQIQMGQGQGGPGEGSEGEGVGKPVREGALRVMILDDEPIVGKRLTPALEKHGFEVEVFLDPTQAMARLEPGQANHHVTFPVPACQ